MENWTLEELKAFCKAIKEEPEAYYAFEVMYYTGARLGEMMALTRNDIDFEKETITINKMCKLINGEEVVTSPKSKKDNRVEKLPQVLCDELEEFLSVYYEMNESERLFNKSREYYKNAFEVGLKKAGIKDTSIHVLRHIHMSEVTP